MAAPDDDSRTRQFPAPPAELLSFLAHELRSPATVAAGTLAMLESGRFEPLPPPQLRAVEMAGRAVARVQAMADDMSLVARVARGDWPLHFAPVSIHDIIADVAHTLHGLNPAPAVDIPFDSSGGATDSAADVPTTVADRTAIARAVVALAHYVVREATSDGVALRLTSTSLHHWLIVSAPGPVDVALEPGAPDVDPSTNGSGFALHAAAAVLGLHRLRAVRLATSPDSAAVGIAFPR